jgi:hypothetical protein
VKGVASGGDGEGKIEEKLCGSFFWWSEKI